MKQTRKPSVKGRKAQKGGVGDPIVATIEGTPGSNFLTMNLTSGQKIQSSPGSLIYMKGDITKGEIAMNGIGKAFARAFGGEDFLITSYTGGVKGGEIAFGSDIPGDITRIDLLPNEEYIISQGSFLCCTEDIEISATVRIRGFLSFGQEEGGVLPVVRTKTGGSVWLCAYGTFKQIQLNNESIILDNGTFLACHSSMTYTLESLGKGALSFVFGGEGLGMRFEGSGPIWIQSKNLNGFLGMVAAAPASFSGEVKREVGEGVGNALVGILSGNNNNNGGGAKGTKRRSNSKPKPKQHGKPNA